MLDKDAILREIRRTAEANGGVALGVTRFCQELGLRREDLIGRFFVRWSDAVREAGVEPLGMTARIEEDVVAERLVALVRSLGHYPVRAELQLARRRDPRLPHFATLKKRFASKAKVAEAIVAWCGRHPGHEDVIGICEPLTKDEPAEAARSEQEERPSLGDVYLIKSGKFYKIGRSNAAGRREREIALQLPQKAERVHTIRTDDPPGIEAYWHGRFADRRKNGEWFELTAEDVRAFRRRRTM